MSRPRPTAALAPPGSPLEARLRLARALAARHRRLAAALCAGAAVLVTVSALTPAQPAPGATPGIAAAAGVDGGSAAVPAGAGSTPAAAAERVAVAVRLADPAGLLLLRPGAHVEVVGGAPAGSGAATGDAADATVLAADAVVLALPRVTGEGGAGPGGSAAGSPDGSLAGSLGGSLGTSAVPAAGTAGLEGVVVLSVVRADAHRLAGAAGSRPLSVAVALPGS